MAIFWYWWDCFWAKWHGRRDGRFYGKNNDRPWKEVKDEKGNTLYDDDGKPKYIYPQYENDAVKGYNNSMTGIVRRWEPKDQKFKAKYCIALRNKEQAENELKKSNEDYEKVKQDYENLEKEKQSFSPPPIERKWFYWPLICFLGLLEIPFNAVVFRPFREAEIFNYLIALLLGIVLVGGGHFLGKGIKEKNVLISLISILLTLGISFAIAWMRKEYLTLAGAKLPPMTALWIFFIIAIAIFSFAMLLSYSQHEGDPKVQKNLKNLKDAQKKLKRIGHDKEAFQKKANFWGNKIIEIKTDRVGFFKKNHSELNQYINTAKSIISVYRRELLEKYSQYKQTDTKLPEVPRKYPKLGGHNKILEEGISENLDWLCNHQKETQV